MSGSGAVAVLGIFVVDLAFRAARLPTMGETLLGSGFALGPGGKGSNQAVAAARAGARVRLLTRIGADEFGALARRTWRAEGIDTAAVLDTPDAPTGAAFIFVSATSGENAIIVESGAAARLTAADVEAARPVIAASAVLATQLEQPPTVAMRALALARDAGVVTVLNPAPAVPVDPAIFALCDYVTPNESEAAALTGLPVGELDEARDAADALLARGARAVVLTLGARGALYHDGARSELVPAFNAGPVVETTGAGDAFNGAFAAALAGGAQPLEAVRFGCAAAAISVTRPGTAPSMPRREEINALLARSMW